MGRQVSAVCNLSYIFIQDIDMVVADAESPGPVRKKARLSLKKGSNHVSTNTPTSIEVKEEPLVAK